VSSLLARRDELLAAFAAAGVRTATTAKLSAPCIHVEPGDPWSVPIRMPGRVSRWRLTAIGGKPDSEGALEAIAELIDGADTALRTMRGVELPAWAKPGDYQLAGGSYAASIATIQLDQYGGS
jgi:hypothetical protein